MSPFPPDSQLWIEFLDGRLWRLHEPLSWVDDERGWTVTVPKGFLTDFASIPWPVRAFLSKTGKTYTRAAVLHDWLYAAGRTSTAWDAAVVPRSYADDVLRRAAEEDGCPAAIRQFIYRGVRLGGWRAWRRYREGRGRRPLPLPTDSAPDIDEPLDL